MMYCVLSSISEQTCRLLNVLMDHVLMIYPASILRSSV